MIGLLRGKVVARGEGSLILDVMGVGYEVTTTASSEGMVATAAGEVTLFVHTHVKEDAIQLFGFASLEERDAFRRLLGVSNVGPRIALALLSGMSVAELAGAIGRRDIGRLASVPGIGKKTAERLTVELQDKFRHLAAVTSTAAASRGGPRADLASALANLGYKPAQVDRAVLAAGELLESGADFEDVLREALRVLTRPA